MHSKNTHRLWRFIALEPALEGKPRNGSNGIKCKKCHYIKLHESSRKAVREYLEGNEEQHSLKLNSARK